MFFDEKNGNSSILHVLEKWELAMKTTWRENLNKSLEYSNVLHKNLNNHNEVQIIVPLLIILFFEIKSSVIIPIIDLVYLIFLIYQEVKGVKKQDSKSYSEKIQYGTHRIF